MALLSSRQSITMMRLRRWKTADMWLQPLFRPLDMLTLPLSKDTRMQHRQVDFKWVELGPHGTPVSYIARVSKLTRSHGFGSLVSYRSWMPPDVRSIAPSCKTPVVPHNVLAGCCMWSSIWIAAEAPYRRTLMSKSTPKTVQRESSIIRGIQWLRESGSC